MFQKKGQFLKICRLFCFYSSIILQGMNVDEETIILVLSTHSRKQRQEIADEYKTQQRKVGIGDIARIYKMSTRQFFNVFLLVYPNLSNYKTNK